MFQHGCRPADVAAATGSALTVMAWVMTAAAVVAVVGLPRRPGPASAGPEQRNPAQPITVKAH